MATSNEKLVYHPAMEMLGLSKKSHGKEPSPRHILNYLLLNEIIKESDLQAACDALVAKNASKEPTADLKGREIDKTTAPRQPRTRHIALRFYYDGTEYSGLAQNLGSDTDNSVEKVLFAGLFKTNLCHSRDTYSRCGRTDKGVSSAGQVVAMHLKSNFAEDASWDQAGTQVVKDEELPKNSINKICVWVPPKKGNGPRVQREISEYPYDKLLNNVLPTTIRILGWCPVSNDFSARFSARTRTYRYFFVKRPNMDIDKMKEGLRMMLGKKDFRNFCKMDVEKVYNWERMIHSAEIIQATKDVYFFQILGQAFLWHQIRCMVSVLFLVGRGLEDPSIVSQMLDVEANPGKPAYMLAPERPLVLHHCGFNDLHMGHTAQNLWSTSCELEGAWEEHLLAAARLRNCIQSFKEFKILREDLLEFARCKLKERFNKKQKYIQTKGTWKEHLATIEEGLPVQTSDERPVLLTWEEALAWLASKGLIVSPQSLRESIHIPLLKGFVGPTYEEKVDALGKGSKRRTERYEVNIVKKRKTKEEDAAFYVHMTQQGGSAI